MWCDPVAMAADQITATADLTGDAALIEEDQDWA